MNSKNMPELVGIDTGGTFTDFILYKNESFVSYKIPSTPNAPEQAITAGLKHLNINLTDAHLVHGTTVATNALLEGKGAKTAFITNRGLKDLLHIGRQTRDQLYSLCPSRSRQLVEKSLCFELDARIQASGDPLQPVSQQELQTLKTTLASQNVEAVAICMLFSFLNDTHEREIEEALEKDLFVSCSSQILAEQREYERAVVTWLNSYLSPITQRYLHNLQSTLTTPLHVMQSDATTMPAISAGTQAVRLLLSGPAGGVVAATSIAINSGHEKLLTLDMGGTSTDVSLIYQKPSYTNDGHVAEFPLAISMLDIHTIGAGGGSIARIDDAGGLHVGPESAGAQPGPACYRLGGNEATITDANVVLGRIPVNQIWTSGLQLDYRLAQKALQPLADKMNCTIEEAALGIVELANAHMAQALRVISIHRGHDPSEFSLFPFGGAGGLHMCAVAEQLAMPSILVPVNAGILSAQGMLSAPVGQMASKSICRLWSNLDQKMLTGLLGQLKHEAEKQLAAVNIVPNRVSQWLDLRYQGQSSAISLPWCGDEIVLEFQQAHYKRFGFSLSADNIEVVTARVWAYKDSNTPDVLSVRQGQPLQVKEYVEVVGVSEPVPVYKRNQLVVSQKITGPCIILDHSGTLYVDRHWLGIVNPQGHIHLQLSADCP
ncbi:MAG: hydantoinase/oxoprolinase family protein [Gammaproteobacteria bacterium]|nr:hydantoinase/oxoprolinase family protein [Gammaproteobacteria bacterium]